MTLWQPLRLSPIHENILTLTFHGNQSLTVWSKIILKDIQDLLKVATSTEYENDMILLKNENCGLFFDQIVID